MRWQSPSPAAICGGREPFQVGGASRCSLQSSLLLLILTRVSYLSSILVSLAFCVSRSDLTQGFTQFYLKISLPRYSCTTTVSPSTKMNLNVPSHRFVVVRNLILGIQLAGREGTGKIPYLKVLLDALVQMPLFVLLVLNILLRPRPFRLSSAVPTGQLGGRWLHTGGTWYCAEH